MIGRRSFIGLGASVVALAACKAPGASSAEPDEPGPLMAPATLAGKLDGVKTGKLLVLQVGPKALFSKSHIPGAQWIGEGSSESGYQAFAERLAKTPADVEIVAYCGCCAVADCPNIRPASRAIRESKRANAWVLDLPVNYATNWEKKGFPTER